MAARDEIFAVDNDGWHGADALFAPVAFIVANFVGIGATGKDVAGGGGIQPDSGGDGNQRFGVAKVAAFGEMRREQRELERGLMARQASPVQQA